MSLLMEALKKAEEAKEQASQHSLYKNSIVLNRNGKQALAKSEKMLSELSLLHESATNLRKSQEGDAKQIEPELSLEPIANAVSNKEAISDVKEATELETEMAGKIMQPFSSESAILLSDDSKNVSSESAKLIREIEDENKLQLSQQTTQADSIITQSNKPSLASEQDKAQRMFSVASKQTTWRPMIYTVCGIIIFATSVGIAYYNYLDSSSRILQAPEQIYSSQQEPELEIPISEPNPNLAKPASKIAGSDTISVEKIAARVNAEKAQLAETKASTDIKIRRKTISVAQPEIAKLLDSKVKTASKKAVVTKPTVIAKQPRAKKVKAPIAALVDIVRKKIADPILAQLKKAYEAYHKRNFELAKQTYQKVLSIEPINRDARLGLAAIAMQTNDLAQAHRHYRYLLRINPKDSVALSGIMSAITGANALKSESQIKLLLEQEPQAAHLHFTLGNLLAAQSRWSDAQQSYFQAYRFDPGNADYAYNLAVSLDYLGEQKSALSYYKKSLVLSQNRNVSFSGESAMKRINSLSNTKSSR